jgi:hypothetical protein
VKHLLFSEWRGAEEMEGATPPPPAKPVAINQSGQVVYATSRPSNPDAKFAKFGLVRYDEAVERERRALAETVLGYYALIMPQFAQEAVDKVTLGIRRYWDTRKEQLHKGALEYMANQGDKYLAGKTSFGRLNLSGIKKWTEKVDVWMVAMDRAPRDLPKIMNIHDNFLRIFRILGPIDLPEVENRWVRPMPTDLRNQILGVKAPDSKDKNALAQAEKEERERNELLKKIIPDSFGWSRSPQWRLMQATAEQVRPESLFSARFRGRKDKKPDEFGPTARPGLLPETTKINPAEAVRRVGLTLEQMSSPEDRIRGMDRYIPDLGSMAPEFKDAIERYNLNFGAGPSGTTGTLFTSAIGFGNLAGDDLKRYLLACIAYLVAGGMHTCHEVFTTFNFLFPEGSKPYRDAKYDGCLPLKFRTTREYSNWKAEFHDIAG